jgi:hypothetical protein
MSEGIDWLPTLEAGRQAARASAKLLFVDMLKNPG